MPRQYWKGAALLAPVPSVMVTCGTPERANILTIGWTGVVSTHPPKVYISVRPERHSHGIIRETGEFVINLVPSSLCRTADYVGTVTGRCVDKVRKTGLKLIESKTVAAPTLADCPLALECKVTEILPEGSHDLFLAEVTQVSVKDELLDLSGRLHLERTPLLVFSHGEYFELGRRIGPIGLSFRDKKRKRRSR